MLADAEVELRATRWLIWEGAWKADRGEDARVEASIAKLYSSEVLGRVIDAAVQIHGGYGVSQGVPARALVPRSPCAPHRRGPVRGAPHGHRPVAFPLGGNPVATFNFDLLELPPEAETLRDEVREFLPRARRAAARHKRARSWGGYDREFSRKLGARGWIGLTWPKQYGGHERSLLERYVVLEEMLAAGAPVCAHWVADRQSGPLLLRFGTEAQRAALPAPDRARRALLRHRHERAGLGLRPGLASAPAPRRWRAATTSTAPRCGPATRTSPSTRSRSSAPRSCPTRSTRGSRSSSSISRSPGHHHPPDHRPGRRAPLQRGHFQDCLRARGHAGGRGRRGLEAGDHRAGLRAERPRALPLVAPARHRD